MLTTIVSSRDNLYLPRMSAGQQNIMTVNLEDYFQVGPVSSAVPQRFWQRFERRVERNTLATLDLLDRHAAKAVFFTVGWLADQIPDLLREVIRRGHSIGSKGFYHRPLSQMTRDDFRADAVRSRLALERACQESVVGYRVARGWFRQDDLWALDVLSSEGFEYDSSLLPLGYVGADFPYRGLYPHTAAEKRIWELPISSWSVGPLALPISGGNYVRQLPGRLTRLLNDNWVNQRRHPLIFYFHVWEMDPDQPRISGLSSIEWLRQYRNLDRMPERIGEYLSKYKFTNPETLLAIPRTKLAPGQENAPTPVRRDHGPSGLPVTVVVPCYNEEQNIKYLANTLDRFVEATTDDFNFSFVFVDDGSRDKTLESLQKSFGSRPNCKIVAHERNRGVAASTLTGAQHADTDVVCVLDADCSYDPANLLKMIPLLSKETDLVTASPYHIDGEVLNVPHWRIFLSRGVSVLYGLLLSNKLATYTACVRVYRKASLAGLKLDNEGYFGITEILIRLDQSGARVVECPTVLEARVLGYSKMKIVRTIWGHLMLLGGLARDKCRAHVRSKLRSA